MLKRNDALIKMVTNERVMKRLNLPTFKEEDVNESQIIEIIQMIAVFFEPQLCKWMTSFEKDIEESNNKIDDILWPMIKPIIISLLGISCDRR